MDLSKSALYLFLFHEREEILRHKWLESEKAGHDIGFEKALLSWIRYHKYEWSQEEIERLKAIFSRDK